MQISFLKLSIRSRLACECRLARDLGSEMTVAKLFQEDNQLNPAGLALNQDLLPRIIANQEKQSAMGELVGKGPAAPKAGALGGDP